MNVEDNGAMLTKMSITQLAKNRPPFDVTAHLLDDDGMPVRFLTDPLAETYIEPPGNLVPAGMLPPEDFQVRAALVEMKLFTEQLMDCGVFTRVFQKEKYRELNRIAQEKQDALFTLVNSSREHKAAIRRIVNAMPATNGGREALARYIK